MSDLYTSLNSNIREFVESLPNWINNCENANALDRLIEKINKEVAEEISNLEDEVDRLDRENEKLELRVEELEDALDD